MCAKPCPCPHITNTPPYLLHHAAPPAIPRWPTLYLEILSESLLGICRTEGYCHLPVPAAPGALCRRLAAWRPTGSRQAQLRRFFVGGAPELEDVSFVGVPADFQVRG